MLQRDLQKKPEQEGLSITLFSAMGEYHYLSCHPHRGQQIPALDQGGSGDKQTGGPETMNRDEGADALSHTWCSITERPTGSGRRDPPVKADRLVAPP